MSTSHARGLYLLSPEHAEPVRRLVADPSIAESVRASRTGLDHTGADFVALMNGRREAGTAYGFATVDGGEVVGVVTLEGIYEDGGPDLVFWVGRPHWRKGYATFAVKMALEFAFQNLRLERVRAAAAGSNIGALRVLEKQGFAPSRSDAAGDAAEDRAGRRVDFTLERQRWIDLRDNPALAALHPALREILAAELAAGNEVLETGRGYPDPDSVFVRLRHPFRTRPSPLPGGVEYNEPNDPHWWMADYSSRSPRHTLAC